MNFNIEKGKVRQLEIFPYLEDAKEYESKLEAWKYFNLTTEERNAELVRIQTEAKIPPNTTRFGNAEAVSFLLNTTAKFPLTSWKLSTLPGMKDILIYKNTDQFREYCKDILDKDGHLLPSKYQQKVA